MRVVLIIFLVLGCIEPPAEWEPSKRNLLFIGNSLTYSNNLPEMVAAMARSASGEDIGVYSVSLPDFSLEDHWNYGKAAELLQKRVFETIVIQQGPSAMGSNPQHVANWTQIWSEEAKKYNAKTMVFMVWPSQLRPFDVNTVIEAYENAAIQSNSLLAPAGRVWKRMREEDPEEALYSTDGFHPSYIGSWVAALSIVSLYFDVNPDKVPHDFDFSGGSILIPTETAELARRMVKEEMKLKKR